MLSRTECARRPVLGHVLTWRLVVVTCLPCLARSTSAATTRTPLPWAATSLSWSRSSSSPPARGHGKESAAGLLRSGGKVHACGRRNHAVYVRRTRDARVLVLAVCGHIQASWEGGLCSTLACISYLHGFSYFPFAPRLFVLPPQLLARCGRWREPWVDPGGQCCGSLVCVPCHVQSMPCQVQVARTRP